MVTFQEQFDALAAHVREVRGGYHVTLGELIDTLAGVESGADVYVDRGGSVRDFRSYRDYYNDLALGPDQAVIAAGALHRQAVAADGGIFEGYKGGDYRMGRDAPLWIAEWGRASGLAIVDVAVEEWVMGPRVRLTTKQVDS